MSTKTWRSLWKKCADSAKNDRVKPGELREKYEQVNKVLGHGAGAVVCLWRSRETRELVAVKQIEKGSSTEHKKALKIASKEANTLKKLKGHVNVLQLKGIFHEPYMVYFVYEQYANDLELAFKSFQRAFTECEALPVMRQICDGLAWIHSKGVCHRDLKMANILTKDETDLIPLVIADFDGAFWNQGEHNPQINDLTGTISTLAPEVARAWDHYDCTGKLEHFFDKKCDIYALGSILFTILTGAYPCISAVCPQHPNIEFHWSCDSCRHVKFTEIGQCTTWKQNCALRMFSAEARQFLKETLTSDPADRLTAEQASQHIWLRGSYS